MTSHTEYIEQVFAYMEYLGVPEYVADYKPEDVAGTYGRTIAVGYIHGISHRMTALVLFSLTLHKINDESVKN